MTATTTNTVTFDAPGIANGTCRRHDHYQGRPAGWSKPYGTGNYAAYKSTDPATLGHYLRVDDNNATNARVRGFETMTTVDNGTGLYPTDAQISGGGYWLKSNTADSTSRNWAVIGDGRIFYVWAVPQDAVSVTSQGTFYWFGDFAAAGLHRRVFLVHRLPKRIQRSIPEHDVLHLGPAVRPHLRPALLHRHRLVGGSSSHRRDLPRNVRPPPASPTSVGYMMAYPNQPDNGFYPSKTLVMEGAANDLHAARRVPGAYFVPQNTGLRSRPGDTVAGQTTWLADGFLALRYGYGGGGTNGTTGFYGVGVFDVTGPGAKSWRSIPPTRKSSSGNAEGIRVFGPAR